ncbi:hypothetical protein [Desulfosporosinus fructosivorans]|uniref:hypothetical protein n=1 Tax=Desulfosporosinus fructosivorans TaxID=2018669 RepID=UPI00130EBC1D|nr:hypothetical protein [Desulfosporosinus fructosivorans]
MSPKRKEISKQVTNQTSTHKNSPTVNTSKKERDAIIPSKDKSPDDLEIFD